MDMQIFTWFLTILWFLFYWVFGGVFFTVIAVIRLGRIKKARFSCLYTILSAFGGYAAALLGVYWAEDSINRCLAQATDMTEQFAAVFACGIVGILSAMLIVAAFLVFGGFIMMRLSRSKEPRWFDKPDDVIEHEYEDEFGEE